MKESTIIGSVPAASELHKVPGFDPMKHLMKVMNAQGQPVMRLSPTYQRLWFRMACPNGRMLLNPLRITDQLAIFEAKVFFHRDDPAPASSFTANKTAQETPNYIRAAQDEALREALDNAGFGIQLCDVAQGSGEAGQRGTDTPPVQAGVNPGAEQAAPPASARSDQPPAQKVASAASETIHVVPPQVPEERPAATEHVGTEPAPEPRPVTQGNPPQEAAPQAAAPQEVTKTVPPQEQMTQAASEQTGAALEAPPQEQSPQTEPPQAAPQQDTTGTNETGQSVVVSILNFQATAEKAEAPQEANAGTGVSAEPVSAPPQEAAVRYTDDTPLEEILTLMTWEEAQAVMAPNGTCTGMTMGEVKERRPSSLRFFLTTFCKCSNIQKAAATLMVQAIEQQKAS